MSPFAIFLDNLRCVLPDEPIVLDLTSKLREMLPVDDGDDEITLSDRRKKGRIAIAVGNFAKHSEVPLRDWIKAYSAQYQISIARNGNYGRYPLAHSPSEYAALQVSSKAKR